MQIKKLLAVAIVMGAASPALADTPRTLASGAPACGNVVEKPETVCGLADSVRSSRAVLAAAIAERRAAIVAVALLPRVLANGRPACGNTNARPIPSCLESRPEAVADRRAQRVQRAVAKEKRARAGFREASRVLRVWTQA